MKRKRAGLSTSAVGGSLKRGDAEVKQMRGFADGYLDTRH
jgi:hypothetical protein